MIYGVLFPPLQTQHTQTQADDVFLFLMISHVFFSSDDALEPFLALVKDTDVDRDYLAQRFKTNVKETLLQEFEAMWTSQHLEVHLAVLEDAKKHCDPNEKAW